MTLSGHCEPSVKQSVLFSIDRFAPLAVTYLSSRLGIFSVIAGEAMQSFPASITFSLQGRGSLTLFVFTI
jgi:hypothetical protein